MEKTSIVLQLGTYKTRCGVQSGASCVRMSSTCNRIKLLLLFRPLMARQRERSLGVVFIRKHRSYCEVGYEEVATKNNCVSIIRYARDLVRHYRATGFPTIRGPCSLFGSPSETKRVRYKRIFRMYGMFRCDISSAHQETEKATAWSCADDQSYYR